MGSLFLYFLPLCSFIFAQHFSVDYNPCNSLFKNQKASSHKRKVCLRPSQLRNWLRGLEQPPYGLFSNLCVGC
ncbi:hypothetical protein PVAP13_4NG122913 [Panicum virgatum]|uniref:Secreted protein n=1 Tax=Panicum virgatum TaxID=38727 RepID=A0A8T0T940_PANVG|nr:hypothetical protein PVAP13_4NG122913 [Panicum virgatum]